MEPRKIIKFGNSSFVITLPTAWLAANNLQKGDSLNLCENKTSLILSPFENIDEKTTTINIDDKVFKLFNRELISYYLKNFKYIKIVGKNVIERLEQIKVLKEKLSSVEIVEIEDDLVVLKDLTNPNDLDVVKIIEKIQKMILILFGELLKDTDRNDKYHLISNLDKNINKLHFLAYKGINYNASSLANTAQLKGGIYYWRVVSSFEEIGDIIKRIARYLKDNTNELQQDLNPIILRLKNYFEFITDLLTEEISFENNLKLYFDKKQSMLKEFEVITESLKENNDIYLVLFQLFKTIMGKLDDVTLSIIDLRCN